MMREGGKDWHRSNVYSGVSFYEKGRITREIGSWAEIFKNLGNDIAKRYLDTRGKREVPDLREREDLRTNTEWTSGKEKEDRSAASCLDRGGQK